MIPQLRFIQTIRLKTESWLQHRHLPWHLGIVAVLLCLPSLDLGLLLDDLFHRATLTRPDLPMISHEPSELFCFIKGDEPINGMLINLGFLPWWSHVGLRVAFFRPLSGYTHWLDYQLWPEAPVWMHFHSLVWLGLTIVATAYLYRRFLTPQWVAGLAALLFALDDAHGLAASWLANRNVLVSLFLGVLVLILHDRWRKRGRWLFAVPATTIFLCALLAKESALAVGGYVVAYALFLDKGRWISRIGSLLPYGVIGGAWVIWYHGHGYGTAHSGWYTDPAIDPLGFVQAAAVRAPTLMAWQWLVPAHLEWAIPERAAPILWLTTMGLLLILAGLAVRFLGRDGTARFWTLGMVLSLVPACAAYPYPRLLGFVGIGGMGLLAQLIAALLKREPPLDRPALSRWLLRGTVVSLLFIHLVAAPLALFRTAHVLEGMAQSMKKAEESLPADAAVRTQTVLIVRTPHYALLPYTALARLLKGGDPPVRTLVLGSGFHAMEVFRPDEKTLVIKPEGGFFESGPDPEVDELLFDHRSAWRSLDRLYRDDTPLSKGQRIDVFGVSVEITEVTEDGRAAEAAFHFLTKLENPYFRWMAWREGGFAPFALPGVGGKVRIPALDLLRDF